MTPSDIKEHKVNHSTPLLLNLLSSTTMTSILQLVFTIALAILTTPDCHGQNLQIIESNSSKVFVQLLRGRDGLPGRDGAPGSAGPPGESGLSGKEGPPGPKSGGATYIRWGKSSCPIAVGTEMVYSGIAAGSFWSQSGSGVNYLCMPKVPQYKSDLRYRSAVDNYAQIEGVEYHWPLQGLHDHNAACAVCYVSTRSAVLVIPAWYSCPQNWTMEYYGYLMTTHQNNKRTTFECVDKDMEAVPGTAANTQGATFYHVEASCNGLPCGPYNNHQELNCVVCSK